MHFESTFNHTQDIKIITHQLEMLRVSDNMAVHLFLLSNRRAMTWHRGKDPASKPENLSSMPGSHMVEGENPELAFPLICLSPHVLVVNILILFLFLLSSFSIWLLDSFYPEQSGCICPPLSIQPWRQCDRVCVLRPAQQYCSCHTGGQIKDIEMVYRWSR